MKKSVISILAVLITIFISNTVLSQDIITKKDGTDESVSSLNPRIENRMGININLLGPSILLSVSIDYFVIPTLNIETGFGVIGYFAGTKYHISGNKVNKNWTPYVGLYVTHIPEISFISDSKSARTGLYIPVGIQYLSNNGFTFGAELAGLTIEDIAGGTPIWGAVKLGYHF